MVTEGFTQTIAMVYATALQHVLLRVSLSVIGRRLYAEQKRTDDQEQMQLAQAKNTMDPRFVPIPQELQVAGVDAHTRSQGSTPGGPHVHLRDGVYRRNGEFDGRPVWLHAGVGGDTELKWSAAHQNWIFSDTTLTDRLFTLPATNTLHPRQPSRRPVAPRHQRGHTPRRATHPGTEYVGYAARQRRHAKSVAVGRAA